MCFLCYFRYLLLENGIGDFASDARFVDWGCML